MQKHHGLPVTNTQWPHEEEDEEDGAASTPTATTAAASASTVKPKQKRARTAVFDDEGTPSKNVKVKKAIKEEDEEDEISTPALNSKHLQKRAVSEEEEDGSDAIDPSTGRQTLLFSDFTERFDKGKGGSA